MEKIYFNLHQIRTIFFKISGMKLLSCKINFHFYPSYYLNYCFYYPCPYLLDGADINYLVTDKRWREAFLIILSLLITRVIKRSLKQGGRGH